MFYIWQVNIISIHSILYFARLISWSEAQHVCESRNMTLLQYDTSISDSQMKRVYYKAAADFGEVMFLGLKRNPKVCNKKQ